MNYLLILIILLLFLFFTIFISTIIKTFKNIPILINEEKFSNNENIIPKKLFQTYHLPKKIPKHIIDLRNMYASDYSYSLYDDDQGLDFLKEYYTDQVVDKYSKLTGAHKADLLRYCLLYIEGGVYMDIKTILTRPLSEIIINNNNNEHKLITAKSINKGTIYQGFLASTPRNPIFLDLIQKILKTDLIEIKHDYIIFTQQFFHSIKKFKDKQDILLYNEVCVKDITKKMDRYGSYCVLKNDNGEVVLEVRDPTYPW
jgi:mannosyltransferase OCH1-like enzyme